MFPLWTIRAQKNPVAEIIFKNRKVEYYPINLINNEFFIIKHVGVFRIQDGTAKIYNGNVRIFQFYVESMNPIDPTITKDIERYCKANNFSDVLPLILEKDPDTEINEPLSQRVITSLTNFRNIDPTHVYQFYTQQQQVHDHSKKWLTARIMPKVEAKTIFFLIVGIAIAVVIIGNFLASSGGFDLDSVTPKFLKGEFLLGLKSFMHL